MKTINLTLLKILIIVIYLLFFLCYAKAQNSFKHYLMLGTTSLTSGVLDGTIESINYHYDCGFKNRCKSANDQFWNPVLSWKNKYMNHDPQQGPAFYGSTSAFVFVTDAYHMLRTAKRATSAFTIAYFANDVYNGRELTKKQRWMNIAKDFLFITACRCAGFTLTYNVMFRPEPMK